MCYARRQRSSWARIKLSIKKFILAVFLLFFLKKELSSFGCSQMLICISSLPFVLSLYFLFVVQFSRICAPLSLLERLSIIPLPSLFVNPILSLFSFFAFFDKKWSHICINWPSVWQNIIRAAIKQNYVLISCTVNVPAHTDFTLYSRITKRK